jgi:regulator of protease activity HflC (stomatin/prohibitin superfamily)
MYVESRVRHYFQKEENGKTLKPLLRETEVWGIEIIDVKIKDIQLPEI